MVRLMNQRRIKNPVKYLRGSVFAKIVNGYKPLTIFAKKSIVDVRLCSKYGSVNVTLHLTFFRKMVYRKLMNFLPTEK